jgi:hypothetical protein
MKVYLDDVRATPEGWVRAFWPCEVIALLEKGVVTHLSLDHDLGNDERGTGYDVVCWIEEAVFVRQFRPPRIFVHSDNSPGKRKMLDGIKQIEKFYRENESRPA